MLRKVMAGILAVCSLLTLAACAKDAKPGNDLSNAPSTSASDEAEAVYASEMEAGMTVDGKIILTLAYGKARSYPDEITQFNSAQDVYEIRGISYRPTDDDTAKDARQKLQADFEAGTAPDLIDLQSLSLEVTDPELSQYAENLRPYMDADPELSWSDLVPSFMNAYAADGKLYSTVPDFAIITVAVKASAVDTKQPWDIDQLQSMANALGGADLLHYIKISNSDFFSSVLVLSIEDYIDLKTGSVNFENDRYRSLLSFCKQLPNENYTGEQTNPNGVLYFDTVSTFLCIQLYEALFQDKVMLIGCPGAGDCGSSFLSASRRFAMNAACEDKEGAWRFLRTFFTEDYQVQNASDFPTNISALNRVIQLAKEGKAEEPPLDIGSTYTKVTDAEIQQVMDLIEATDKVDTSAPIDFFALACSEADAYLNGNADLDTVVASTQRLAEDLMAEKALNTGG